MLEVRMDERRGRKRLRTKVLHRHRVGRVRFLRVSELVFVEGRPKAILAWVDLGAVRTPLYLCGLDPLSLEPVHGTKNTFRYRGETVDPRYGENGRGEARASGPLKKPHGR
jgi:hypothetical protein